MPAGPLSGRRRKAQRDKGTEGQREDLRQRIQTKIQRIQKEIQNLDADYAEDAEEYR